MAQQRSKTARAGGVQDADASSAIEIRDTYTAGIRAVTKVLGSTSATSADKDQAEETLTDLTTSMLAHEIETVQGRTALLTALIVELTAVVDRIETRTQLAPIVAELQGIVDTAKALLTEEKKGLIA